MPTATCRQQRDARRPTAVAEHREHRFGGERLHERDHHQAHTVFRAEHHFHERGDQQHVGRRARLAHDQQAQRRGESRTMRAAAPPSREVSESVKETSHRTCHRTPRTSRRTLRRRPLRRRCRSTRHFRDLRVSLLVVVMPRVMLAEPIPEHASKFCGGNRLQRMARAMMKSLPWSTPRTVSWRSRRSPWAAPRPARPGQERRAPLYGLLLPKMFHAPSSGGFRSSTHRKFAARWHV